MVSEATLETAWRAGSAAWPTVRIERDQLARHLVKVAEVSGDPAHLELADLYLAAAVLANDPAALAVIQSLLPTIDVALRQLGADTTRVEDMRQRVFEVVIVGGERGPAIAGYAGRSDLRSWLRSVGVRTALKAWSREPKSLAYDDDLADVVEDPELAMLKTLYADDVVTATRDALATLSPRARTLLRLHHLDGLTMDDLAAMYQVHRATAARWTAAAREAVFEETRRQLEARLGLGEDSAISIVRLVQSQLMLSMRRLLASQP
jgi:RNA polymerase sigma-70 factor, ECF subfamily